MSILGSLFGTDDNQDNQNKQNGNTNKGNKSNGQETEEGTLQLRKEELDINKNKVQAGEVILSKEVVEEQQSVNVPVTHEEVVIERKTLNNQPTDSQITSSSSGSSGGSDNSSSDSSASSGSNCGCGSETIRIPVTEEQVEIGKHTVVTEEVSAYKHNVEATQKVEQTLKREEAKVDKNGNPIITNNASSSNNGSSNNDSSSNDNTSNSSFQ